MSRAPGGCPEAGPEPTRRGLLLASSSVAAIAAAVGLPGCGSSRRPVVHKIPPAAHAADLGILAEGLRLAEQAIAGYTAVIPLLGGRSQSAAKQFLDEELSHASEFRGLVKKAGGNADAPPAAVDLGRPAGRQAILELLHALERVQIDHGLRNIDRLSPGSVRAAVSSIVANDAQHLAVLRSLLRLEPVPHGRLQDGPSE